MTYVTGYNGTVRDLASLQAWSQWQNLDEEYQRRALGLMDASNTAGRPVGVGSIFRTFEGQLDLALSRHIQVPSGGCCSWEGKRYALRPGMAHAAFPGLSYHEATTMKKKALAIDFIGDLAFLAENASAFGLVEFSGVNREPWHGQPDEIPHSRSKYNLATMDPLPKILLPGLPPPAPTKVWAPLPTQRQGSAGNDPVQVRALQLTCNFWQWTDALNRNLIVDGDFGAKTEQAVRTMQRVLGATSDGQYGPRTASALQTFLDAMTALAG